MSDSLWLHGLYSPWNSWGQNTAVGSLSLLQGIFPARDWTRWNPGIPHCRWILYQLSHKGSPRILEWIDYPFSRGSSWPRNRTRVSCFAGRFFTNWAIKEACKKEEVTLNYLLPSTPASTLPPWYPKLPMLKPLFLDLCLSSHTLSKASRSVHKTTLITLKSITNSPLFSNANQIVTFLLKLLNHPINLCHSQDAI